MAHATLKMAPGVDFNKTPALNELSLSETNLVRFMPDRQGLGLVQKLGGWKKFYPSSFGTPIRALWAWEDTNNNSYLAVGAETEAVQMKSGGGNGAQAIFYYDGPRIYTTGSTITVSGFVPEGYNGVYTVFVSNPGELIYSTTEKGTVTQYGVIQTGDSLFTVSGNSRAILTPSYSTSEPQIAVSTIEGSAEIIIKDPESNLLDNDVVYIKTQISIAGLILFGTYKVKYVSDTQYSITARNIFGAPTPAKSTLKDTGVLPSFEFQTGSAFVNVLLPDHGLKEGDTFTILVPLYNGSVKLFGNYTVTIQDDTQAKDKFTIASPVIYDGKGKSPVIINNDVPYFEYYKTPGPIPNGSGYGVGGYGVGGYGIGEPAQPTSVNVGTPITAKDWTLDNWGEVLIACPVGGSIYKWSPVDGVPQASIIPSAPTANDGMFVAMPQRQIVAWGSTFGGIQDPLLIRWSDVANYDAWYATVTNQAGSYRVSKGSRIVACLQGPQQGLIWTDLAIWSMQYSGPPLVYSFNEIGTGCGLIGRKAAGSLNGVVYWMSQSQFYMLAGSGIEIIPCPIWDIVFQDLDTDNVDKIRFAANSNYSEISWFYPTKSSKGEVSRYVKLNVQLGAWDYGDLSRTAWINQSVFGPPIGAGSDKFIYQHETSEDADGLPMNSWFKTGYSQIGEAEYKIFVDQIWPDFKWGQYGQDADADLKLTFYVTDYAGKDPRVYGPYSMNKSIEFLTPRFRGRLVSIKIESSDLGSFWRIGAMRYRFTPDGKF
jgi:hypothetical protein